MRENKIKSQRKFLDNTTYEDRKNLYGSNRRAALQYDLDGNFIREWDALIDIQNELGIFSVSVSRVCKGKRKTAGSFKWKYKD